MKAVIQRVKRASVTVEEKCIGKIEKGLVIFLGVGQEDTKEITKKLWEKIIKLRIFADENRKINLSVQDIEGEILIISQFTLYADCKKGNRPSFTTAAPPSLANELYEYFISLCRQQFGKAEHGEFGADMQIELINDGPFTIILE